jgi:hypothetical protein
MDEVALETITKYSEQNSTAQVLGNNKDGSPMRGLFWE